MSPVLKDHPLFPMYKTQNYLEDSSWFSICTHLCKYNHTWKCHLGQAKEPFQCQQTPVKNYYYNWVSTTIVERDLYDLLKKGSHCQIEKCRDVLTESAVKQDKKMLVGPSDSTITPQVL